MVYFDEEIRAFKLKGFVFLSRLVTCKMASRYLTESFMTVSPSSQLIDATYYCRLNMNSSFVTESNSKFSIYNDRSSQ